VIDIETAPIRFTDPEIVDYQIDKSFNRDFHPFFAKVVAAGLKQAGKTAEVFCSDDEGSILTAFWRRLRELGPRKYVTFNGYQFDVPFLLIRSKFQRIRAEVEINLNLWKMEDSNHFDCMQALSLRRTFPWVSLDITCRMLGVTLPRNRLAGKEIPDLYAKKSWKQIEAHNRQDLELTEALYLRVR